MVQDHVDLVSLRAVLLKEFDIQKVYLISTDIARSLGCIFEGVSLYELPTAPPSLADCLTFSVSQNQVDDVILGILKGLEADRSVVRFTVSPQGKAIKAGRQEVVFKRLRSYLKTNWGSPFIVGFMVLLVASAVQLSMGAAGVANNVAVYAFYSLVLGVALQIASFVKYGDGDRSSTSGTVVKNGPTPRFRPTRRLVIAAVVVSILLVASLFVATGMLFHSSPPTGCSGPRDDGTVFISSTTTVTVKICGEDFAINAGEGGGLTYHYHAGVVRFSAPTLANGTEFTSWYAVLAGNPKSPVDNSTFDLNLPGGLSAQSSSIEAFYSPSNAAPSPQPANSTSTASSSSSSVSFTSTNSSNSNYTSTASNSSSASASLSGCQGTAGQFFLATNINESIPLSVCGQELQVSGGEGGGLNFAYHAGLVTFEAPQTAAGTHFQYWYVVLPTLHEQITSNFAEVQIPAGLSVDGAIIIAVYG